jgi:hypothetical protein
VPVIQ